MDICDLCNKFNYKSLEQYSLFNTNIISYFAVNNQKENTKYYQCVCYNKCIQYSLYKDKNKWLNYIGLLLNSNHLIVIEYNNKKYYCTEIEVIPKNNFLIKYSQFNTTNIKIINITNIEPIQSEIKESKVIKEIDTIENGNQTETIENSTQTEIENCNQTETIENSTQTEIEEISTNSKLNKLQHKYEELLLKYIDTTNKYVLGQKKIEEEEKLINELLNRLYEDKNNTNFFSNIL